jgi:small basic protein (TIGR04137 family)
MSIHSSLRGISTLAGERSVLSRFERVQKMMRDGKLKAEGGSPFGLPKMRTKIKVAGKKPKEAPKAEDEKGKKDAKKPAAGAAAPAKAAPAKK